MTKYYSKRKKVLIVYFRFGAARDAAKLSYRRQRYSKRKRFSQGCQIMQTVADWATFIVCTFLNFEIRYLRLFGLLLKCVGLDQREWSILHSISNQKHIDLMMVCRQFAVELINIICTIIFSLISIRVSNAVKW